MEIDFEVYLFGDPSNEGRATYIHPVSGYVWVDSISGHSDFVSPINVTALYDKDGFNRALESVQ